MPRVPGQPVPATDSNPISGLSVSLTDPGYSARWEGDSVRTVTSVPQFLPKVTQPGVPESSDDSRKLTNSQHIDTPESRGSPPAH